jgi:indole-3-glycerol phosphate synthase
MSTILDTIVARKREEILARRAATSMVQLEARIADSAVPRGFAANLAMVAETGPAMIAEIKRGSPSLGLIRPDLVAANQAQAYTKGGAAALSVLTDIDFFFGSDADFASAREATPLPMLRKEFIIDEYQLYESRALGADCVLLILAILSDKQVTVLAETAHALGMDVLAETHTADEIKRARDHVPYDLLGINNRNLKTFETNAQTTFDLAGDLPAESLVAESGLHSPDVIADFLDAGIRRFLIGEAFVRAPDPEATVASFFAAKRQA